MICPLHDNQMVTYGLIIGCNVWYCDHCNVDSKVIKVVSLFLEHTNSDRLGLIYLLVSDDLYDNMEADIFA